MFAGAVSAPLLPGFDSRPPNTLGDEDAHYLIAKEYAQWYRAVWTGDDLERTPRYFFQRPVFQHQ